MRLKSLKNAKLIVKIISDKEHKQITAVSVHDNRTNSDWGEDRIKERGITHFLNMDDVKETLNWNLNGDSSKYQFGWGMTVNGVSDGYAYIFDQNNEVELFQKRKGKW